MKFLILTHQYPRKDNLYRSGFVHQRVKEYQNKGFESEVWVLDNTKKSINSYVYEGVAVYEGNTADFKRFIEKNEVSSILVHFLLEPTMEALKNLSRNIPIIIWVHLYEASSWHRRLFDFTNMSFLKYIINNKKQLRSYKLFYENTNLNTSFIFVSNWIKNIAEKDIKVGFENSNIIPNYINSNLYNYHKKDVEKRKKILSIRTFQSKKYGNDITAKVIKILSERPEFSNLEFSLYGKGKYFEKIKNELSAFPNVKMYDTFLNQQEIAKLHENYGIFLCPTRQDSQGVSMCEAMSSGLVPITSNNSAIPEFVKHGETGFLGEDAEAMANSILYLYHNENEFIKISQLTSKSINELCGLSATIDEEIKVILNSIKNA